MSSSHLTWLTINSSRIPKQSALWPDKNGMLIGFIIFSEGNLQYKIKAWQCELQIRSSVTKSLQKNQAMITRILAQNCVCLNLTPSLHNYNIIYFTILSQHCSSAGERLALIVDLTDRNSLPSCVLSGGKLLPSNGIYCLLQRKGTSLCTMALSQFQSCESFLHRHAPARIFYCLEESLHTSKFL